MSLTLYVSRHIGGGSDRVPIEVPSDITSHELHHEVADLLVVHAVGLSHGGKWILYGDDPVSDLGLSHETTIEARTDIPDYYRLLMTFGHIMKRTEGVGWWEEAHSCATGEWLESNCSNELICSNQSVWTKTMWTMHYGWQKFIECNEATNEIVKINGDVIEETLVKAGFNLKGSLSLRFIPDSVKSIMIRKHKELTAVDLRGLSHGKSLKELDLKDNGITDIDLQGLRGSALEYLNLEYNQISAIKWTDLKDSNLTWLWLRNNQISNLSLADLKGSKLRELVIEKNKLSTFNLRDLRELKSLNLKLLTLSTNQISGSLDVADLNGASMEKLNLGYNQIVNVSFANASDCFRKNASFLYLYGNPIQNIDFGGIQNSNLQKLWIGKRMSLRSVRNINELKRANISGRPNDAPYDFLMKYYHDVPGVNDSDSNDQDAPFSVPTVPTVSGVSPPFHSPNAPKVDVEFQLFLSIAIVVGIAAVFAVIFEVGYTIYEIRYGIVAQKREYCCDCCWIKKGE